MIPRAPSSLSLYFLTCLEQKVTSHLMHGSPNAGLMDLWQVTLHVSLMTQATGQGQRRIRGAGHAISTKQSYLGIEDALRKLRLANGTQRPGVWVGVSMCVEEDCGVVVLTSQEKWHRMKTICNYWLNKQNQGVTNLES
jgi:hypothetical protein